MKFTIEFADIRMKMIPQVGTKNASLGEMVHNLHLDGISFADGFAITVTAYLRYLKYNGLDAKIARILKSLQLADLSNIGEVSKTIRDEILHSAWPLEIEDMVRQSYDHLEARSPPDASYAIRCSVTSADFSASDGACQLGGFLNVRGVESILDYGRKCYASLFTSHAIRYRLERRLEKTTIAASVGVQRMVRSDLACSGVAYTSDPHSGNPKNLIITSSYGLGDYEVHRSPESDRFFVFKSSLKPLRLSIGGRILGAKTNTIRFTSYGSPEARIESEITEASKQGGYSLDDEEVLKLAAGCQRVEDYYGQAMELEWAKDGVSGDLFIVQARPLRFSSHPV